MERWIGSCRREILDRSLVWKLRRWHDADDISGTHRTLVTECGWGVVPGSAFGWLLHGRSGRRCVKSVQEYPGWVITCIVDYTIDPTKIEAFEAFAQAWIELVERHGGVHHGYFLPAEGASDKALALFSFESLAAYERYRSRFGADPDFIAADRIRDESGCVLRYSRTFMRPVLPSRD